MLETFFRNTAPRSPSEETTGEGVLKQASGSL